MKKKFTVLAAVLVLLCSCTKEDSVFDNTGAAARFTLCVGCDGDGLKTTVEARTGDSRKIFWNEGDRICVNGFVSDALGAEYDGKPQAVFTFGTQDVGDGPYRVCFPADAWVDSEHIRLERVQAGNKGNDTASDVPMAAYSAKKGEKITLRHLLSYVHFKFSGNQKIDFLELSGNDGEQLSGTFGFDYSDDGMLLVPDTEKSASSKTVRVDMDAQLAEGGLKYCLVGIPAGTCSTGMTLRIATSDAHYMERESTYSSLTTHRAQITGFTEIAVDAKGDIVHIVNAADWNGFATACNNSAYSDPSKLYAVIDSDIDFKSGTFTSINTFRGRLDGQGHVFSNAPITNSIIGELAGGCVCDLNIDKSCSITAAASGSSGIFMGAFAGKVSGGRIVACSSEAPMSIGASVTSVCAGGIAGQVTSGDFFKELDGNRVSGNISITKSVKDIICGGLVGDVNCTAGIRLGGTPFSATSISFTSSSATTHGNIFIGGLFGRCTAEFELDTDRELNLVNAISMDCKSLALTAGKVCIGGLIGNASGPLTIGGKAVVKTGDVIVSGLSSSAFSSTLTGVGGIVGGADAGAHISNASVNSSNIGNDDAPTKTDGKSFNAGGIAGYLRGGANTLEKCSNSAYVMNNHYSNSLWTSYVANNTGGIVGAAGYSSGNTYPTTFSQCSNKGKTYAYRGTCGGICGYAGKAAFIGCTNEGTVTRGQPAGGIAGAAEKSSFTDCTNTAANVSCKTAGDMSIGGIAGSGVTLTMDGCKSSSTLSSGTYVGGIAGSLTGTNLIGKTTPCLVKGSVSGKNITTSYLAVSTGAGNGLPADAMIYLWQDGNPLKISIIGDSISTFDGCNTPYNVYYKSSTGDVNFWFKTYWGRLITAYIPNAVLEKNIASSGSCVSRALETYSTDVKFRKCFVTRYDESGIGDPDYLIIYGGTNDNFYCYGTIAGHDILYSPTSSEISSRCNAAIGSLDIDYYADAYITLMWKVLTGHSGTKIICLLGDGMSKGECDTVSEICKWFSENGYSSRVRTVNFHNSGNDDGKHYDNVNIPKYNGVHPNAKGMDYMANKIYNEIGF